MILFFRKLRSCHIFTMCLSKPKWNTKTKKKGWRWGQTFRSSIYNSLSLTVQSTSLRSPVQPVPKHIWDVRLLKPEIGLWMFKTPFVYGKLLLFFVTRERDPFFLRECMDMILKRMLKSPQWTKYSFKDKTESWFCILSLSVLSSKPLQYNSTCDQLQDLWTSTLHFVGHWIHC